MIGENSRYRTVAQDDVPAGAERRVRALRIRRLPVTAGPATTVDGRDQLDVMALRRYGDGTRYWHIADANTALEAATLLEPPGRTIAVPES